MIGAYNDDALIAKLNCDWLVSSPKSNHGVLNVLKKYLEKKSNKQDLRIPKFSKATFPFKNSYSTYCIRHIFVVPCD